MSSTQPGTPSTLQFGGRDWSTYYAAVAGKPPRDTLLHALRAFERDDSSSGCPAPACSEAGAGTRRLPLALDLGCGEGRDTRELLQRGWSVVAIDPHPAAAGYMQRIIDELAAPPPTPSRGTGVPPVITQSSSSSSSSSSAAAAALHPVLHFASITLEDAATSWHACQAHGPARDAMSLPMHVDLVNASFVLPFVPPPAFASVWSWIRSVLVPSGRFSGQFFGVRDS